MYFKYQDYIKRIFVIQEIKSMNFTFIVLDFIEALLLNYNSLYKKIALMIEEKMLTASIKNDVCTLYLIN